MILPAAKLDELLHAARSASQFAYNRYSRFAVGCALLTESGNIYRGCNIENASYSVTICAERVAASQAILNGEHRWQAIVIVSSQRVTPCGVCRQFLAEFAPDLFIWLGGFENDNLTGPFQLRDLFPAPMVLDIESIQ